MSRAFFLSILIHSFLIYIIISIPLNIEKKVDNKNLGIKKISLKQVILKKEEIKKDSIKKSILKADNEKSVIKKEIKKIISNSTKKSIKRVKKIKRAKKRVKKVKSVIAKKKIIKRVKRKRVIKEGKKVSKDGAKKFKKSKKVTKRLNRSSINKDYFLVNKSSIYKAIQRAKKYPAMAKRVNITGVVTVSFKIAPSGRVSNITAFGAHSLLNKSAKETIIRASSNFPKPNRSVDVTLNIAYTLR